MSPSLVGGGGWSAGHSLARGHRKQPAKLCCCDSSHTAEVSPSQPLPGETESPAFGLSWRVILRVTSDKEVDVLTPPQPGATGLTRLAAKLS